MSTKHGLLALLGASAIIGALAACESAVNLDVDYRDAQTSNPNDASAEASGPGEGVALEGCPCDESQGFGCCVTTNGPSFCTTELAQCTQERGVFMRCFRANPLNESECCWHGDGPGAVAAYAGACDGGPPACVLDTDCRSQPTARTCLVRPCGGLQIGFCGQEGGAPPSCP